MPLSDSTVEQRCEIESNGYARLDIVWGKVRKLSGCFLFSFSFGVG